AECRLEAVLMRPAGRGTDAVDVGADRLLRRFRPLKRDLELVALLAFRGEYALRDRVFLGVLDESRQELWDTTGVRELEGLARRLVLEHNFQTAVDVRDVFQAHLKHVRIEVCDLEDPWVRFELNDGSVPTKRTNPFEFRAGHPLRESLAIFETIAANRGDKPATERVHHGCADSVQASGVKIAARLVAELAAGVQHGQDALGAALLVLRMHIHGNAATVVLHRDRVAALVQNYGYRVGVPVQVLVHRVIDDFPGEMMEPLRVNAADVHRRPLANGFEPFEDLDRV